MVLFFAAVFLVVSVRRFLTAMAVKNRLSFDTGLLVLAAKHQIDKGPNSDKIDPLLERVSSAPAARAVSEILNHAGADLTEMRQEHALELMSAANLCRDSEETTSLVMLFGLVVVVLLGVFYTLDPWSGGVFIAGYTVLAIASTVYGAVARDLEEAPRILRSLYEYKRRAQS